jgi:hypothetical protein
MSPSILITETTPVLKEEDLAAFFAARGISTPFSYDTLPDASPTRVHALGVTGGLGLAVEQFFDRPTFQVLTRGANGVDARDMALEVDAAWLDADPGFYIGDFWVTDKGRFGGPPSYVATDERNRVLRAATYYCEIER